jgi:hypothetical protein
LFKLNKLLVQEQKDLIEQWGWGDMLKVQATELSVDLSMWVLSCFDPIRSDIAIPGGRSIPVTAESFSRVFEIPNEGIPVCYEMEADAIAFMNQEYGIESGKAVEWDQWRTLIKNMAGPVDMKFLYAYIAAVISCFVSPTTNSSITPRCYRSIVDLNQVRRTNFAQFAIDQITIEVSVSSCLFLFIMCFFQCRSFT